MSIFFFFPALTLHVNREGKKPYSTDVEFFFFFLFSSRESPSPRPGFRVPIPVVVDRTPHLAFAEPRSRLPFLAEERHVAQEHSGGRTRPRHPRRVLQGDQRHRNQGDDRHALHYRVVSTPYIPFFFLFFNHDRYIFRLE